MATNDAEYQRRHKKVRGLRGLANQHNCQCGKRACDWSHIHGTNPEEVENYQPMCRSCHQKYDLPDEVKARQLAERQRVESTPVFKGWSPERREAQRQRMLKKWSDPEAKARQSERASRDKPWTGRWGVPGD